MGLDLTNLPESFLSKLPLEERKKLGRIGMTSDEAQAKYVARNERELQRDIAQYLNRHGYYYVTPRMDKKSTIGNGAPDFVVSVSGKFVAIEAKCAATRGKLTPDQERVMRHITSSPSNGCCLVIYSIEELIRALSEIRGQ